MTNRPPPPPPRSVGGSGFANPNAGNGNMMKILIPVIIGVVVLLIIIIAALSGGGNSSKRWYILSADGNAESVSDAQGKYPQKIEYYFDTSGSMRGFLQSTIVQNQYVSVLNGLLGDDFKFNSAPNPQRMAAEYYGYGEWDTAANNHMGVYRFAGDEETAKANAREKLKSFAYYNALYNRDDENVSEFERLINSGVVAPEPGFENNAKHENYPFSNLTRYLRTKWAAETPDTQTLTVITTDLLEQRNNANAFEDIFVAANNLGKSAAMIVVGANFDGFVFNLYESSANTRPPQHTGKKFFGVFIFGKASEVQNFAEALLNDFIEPFCQDRENNPVGYEFFYNKNDLISNGPEANFNPVVQIPEVEILHPFTPHNNSMSETRGFLSSFRKASVVVPAPPLTPEENWEVTPDDVFIAGELGVELEKRAINILNVDGKSRYVFAVPVNYNINDSRQVSLSHRGGVSLYEINGFSGAKNDRAARNAFADDYNAVLVADNSGIFGRNVPLNSIETLLTGTNGTVDPNRLVPPSTVQFFTKTEMLAELEGQDDYLAQIDRLTNIEGREFIFLVFELNNSEFFAANMNTAAYRLSIGAKPEYVGTDYTSVFANVRPISPDQSGRRLSIIENYSADNPAAVVAATENPGSVLPMFAFGSLISAIQKEYGAFGDMPDVLTFDFFIYASRSETR